MNAKNFVFAPLFVIATGALAMGAAHAGTVTVSGFSAARTPGVLLSAEALATHGRPGRISATCDGFALQVSQTKALGRVNAELVQECTGGKLAVKISSKSANPKS